MRDPRHYNRSLMLCQSVVTVFYIVVGVVIYYYCGSYVSSPALGSAGPTVKKVSYGFALPGLIASTLLFVHVRSRPFSRHLTHQIPDFSDTNNHPDHRKIHVYPHPPRLPPSSREHHDSLVRLARMHLRHINNRLHHRQRYPRLQ